MLILIHGEDVEKSRKKLTEEIAGYGASEIARLDGAKLTMEELIQAFESHSLFASKRTVVIEKLLSGKKSKARDELLSYLTKEESPHLILIWQDTSVDKRILAKSFAKARVLHFPTPQNLFRFLDSLIQGSPEQNLRLFHDLLRTEDVGLVYSMMLRQWRNMIIAKDLGASGFSGNSAWMAGKLRRQAGTYTLDQLIRSYRQLITIDVHVKSGTSPLSYRELIDIFICSI